MMELRVWLKPPLLASGSVDSPLLGRVEVRTVESPEREKVERYTMLLARVEGAEDGPKLLPYWEELEFISNALCLAELSSSKVVAASAIPADVQPDQEVDCWLHEWIPSSTGHSYLGGFPKLRRDALSLLARECAPEVRVALHWFVKALRTAELPEKSLFLWTSIEALADEVQEAPKCQKCECDLACPKGHPVPAGHRVRQAIKKLTEKHIKPKDLDRLYKIRSKLVHGAQSMDRKLGRDLQQPVLEIAKLAVTLICERLRWPKSDGPAVTRETLMMTVDVMKARTTFTTHASNDTPVIMKSSSELCMIPARSAYGAPKRRRPPRGQ